MSKAIQGAAELGAAVGFFAAAALIPGAALLVGSVAIDIAMAGVGLMGAGMEAGAIADALTSNRGENITIRQPAAPRQIVYGVQRVGGVLAFASTTGSSKDQLNRLFVLATHELYAIQNLYLDGRQVYWKGSGSGWAVRNGYGFGGGGDGQTHVGPDGSDYVFNDATSGHSGVYVEARYGDQAAGDYMGSLQANDGRWGPSSGSTPYGGGCAYIYLKAEASANTFPQEPEIKATVLGKPVYDPRTGQTTYSDNWALVLADYIKDSDYGLGDAVNEEQLIAAANIADEMVTCAAGQERRYTCHYHFDTSTAAGDVISAMLQAAGGRLSYIGGEYYLWPATWLGPTLSLSEDDLIDKPTWKPTRAYRSLFNRVQGTYTAANFPYSAASGSGLLSDEYDSNGWYDGQIENTFPFAFQPSSYPTYAADTLHGYASDQWLNADGGVELYQTLDLPSVLSVSQAQRLAKIELRRNRQQGSGTLVFSPKGYQLQAGDTFYMSFAQRGWANKLLEVTDTQFVVDKDANGIPLVKVLVSVQECASSTYEWEPSEELTPYDVPANPTLLQAYTTAPPTNVQLISGASSALVNADGTVTPRIEVTWDTPEDVRVAHIQTQYRLTGASTWTDGGTVGADSNLMFIGPIIAGQDYDVQIRSLQANGAASVWETVSGFGTSIVLSVSTQSAIGPGSLVGMAYSDGTAAIDCMTFSTLLGGKSVTYFPTAQLITGLAQQQLYYVYVVDPNLTGGNLTPLATQNKADFIGKLGYFLVDSIVTPYASSSGGGGTTSTRSYPVSASDTGSRSTQNPGNAYDGNLSTYATVSSTATFSQITSPGGEEGPPHTAITTGSCTWNFGATTTAASMTLSVIAAATITSGTVTLTASLGGTRTTLLTATGDTGQNTYNLVVPSGTDLSTVTVNVTAEASLVDGENPDSETASAQITEIYIQ